MTTGRFVALGLLSCLAGGFPGPAGAQTAHPDGRGPAVVTIVRDGRAFVGERETADVDLPRSLRGIVASDGRVYVRGDVGADATRVMRVMEIIREAGFTKVALLAMRDGR